MKIARFGVALAKSVLHVRSVACRNRTKWREKLKHNERLDAVSERLAPGAE